MMTTQMMLPLPLPLLLLLLPLAGGTAGLAAGAFTARLQWAESPRPCAVVQIEASGVPAQSNWFRLRGVSPGWTFPIFCDSYPDCDKGPTDQWFPRTQQNLTQYAFYGTQSTISGSGARSVNTFVVEAWTSRSDLGDSSQARLLAKSPALVFTFDDKGFSRGLDMGPFSATDTEAGEAIVVAHPTRTDAWSMVELMTWSGWHFTGKHTAASKRPVFAFSEGLLFEQFTPRQYPLTPDDRHVHLNVSFSSPGIYYLGMYGVWNGVYGYTAPAPENGVNGGSFPQVHDSTTGKMIFQPLALVVPWENGSVPLLPTGFLGAVHQTRPIPGDQRLALLSHAITVFHGGSIWVRCTHGNSVAAGPSTIELELPEGLQLLESGLSGKGLGLMGFENITDVSALLGGGHVSPGYLRVRLDKSLAARWGEQNTLKLQFAVTDSALVGRTFALAKIRCYSTVRGQKRPDNWQALSITIKALVPVPVLPKRLHTSYCWSCVSLALAPIAFAPRVLVRSFARSSRMIFCGLSDACRNPWLFPTDAKAGLNSLTLWRSLGFNTLPGDGGSESTGPSLGGVGGNAQLAGMKTGAAFSPFRYGSLHGAPGCILALTLKNASVADQLSGILAIPNVGLFNLSDRGLTTAEAKAESIKWRAGAYNTARSIVCQHAGSVLTSAVSLSCAALEFNARQGGGYGNMDMSYDGWFFTNDLATIASRVKGKDYMTWDVEQFPDFATWSSSGERSAPSVDPKLAPQSPRSMYRYS